MKGGGRAGATTSADTPVSMRATSTGPWPSALGATSICRRCQVAMRPSGCAATSTAASAGMTEHSRPINTPAWPSGPTTEATVRRSVDMKWHIASPDCTGSVTGARSRAVVDSKESRKYRR
jgi:hypothetical protein